MGDARAGPEAHRGRDRIRARILIAFERAELAQDAAERQRLLTFVIVGGGATGVEMAGAIAEVARQHACRTISAASIRARRASC